MDEVATLMRVKAISKGLNWRVEYETPMPAQIHTDPLRLRQILVNLIGNGIKFTEFGSVRLVCRTLPAQERLEFDIIDTGIGLSETQQRRLFQPFVQSDSSLTRRFGGTGLGLTISRRFAAMLGGDVIIVKSAVGQGSCFRLSINTGSLIDVPLVAEKTPTTRHDVQHRDDIPTLKSSFHSFCGEPARTFSLQKTANSRSNRSSRQQSTGHRSMSS
jgi:nitrogen fixation/metabolism regulation signal transduction histidine kinase